MIDNMPWTSAHLKWLINTGQELTTPDGRTIEVWKYAYQDEDGIFTSWSKHFRNHYCLDTEIDFLRQGTKYSRAEYLTNLKFPDPSSPPGPSIRAGDFGEILVADYVEFVLGYWVPRTRFADKTVRNESTKGCDIIGFKIENGTDDTLAIFEAKTQFSGTSDKSRLQDAIDGSRKDQMRKGESLNAVKQSLSESRNRVKS